MCPFSDSRQIYKNQFDKKEKEEKKNIPLQKNHTSTPILFRFQRILITKWHFSEILTGESKYIKSKGE